MRCSLIILSLLVLVACRQVSYDVGPVVPDIEVRVLRTQPKEALLTLEHHGQTAYIVTTFLVLEPTEYHGREFRLNVLPEYQGKLFEVREFRLRLAANLVLGKNRERKNADGTTTVWSDTNGYWNFEAMTLEAIKDSGQPSGPATPEKP